MKKDNVDAAFRNENQTNNQATPFALLELFLYVFLSAFLFYKALRGGLIYSNIIFNHACFYFTLALAFMFVFFYRIAKKSKLRKNRILKTILFFICCLLFALSAFLIIGDNTSFYNDTTVLPVDIEIITADDVFNKLESNEREDSTTQVRSWHPFLNTTVNEVQQSISNNSNNYFYSVKLNASKWFLHGFKEEIFKQLHNENMLSFDLNRQTISTGSFKKDTCDYRFILKIEDDSLICIIYRGDFLLKQELIYPLFE